MVAPQGLYGRLRQGTIGRTSWCRRRDGNIPGSISSRHVSRQVQGGRPSRGQRGCSLRFNRSRSGPILQVITALSKLSGWWFGENTDRDRNLLEGAQGVRRTRDGRNPDEVVPASLRRIRGDRALHNVGAADPVEVEGDRRARRPEGRTRESSPRILLAVASFIGRRVALPEQV